MKLQKVLNALDRHGMWGVLKAMDYDTGWRIRWDEKLKEGADQIKEGIVDLFSW